MFLGTHISVGIPWLMRSGTYKHLWRIPEKESGEWIAKVGYHFVYTMTASTPKYIQPCGRITTTRTKGSLRTLSWRRGLPDISPSTISSTDPYWSLCFAKLDAVRPIRTVLEPAFTWRKRRYWRFTCTWFLFPTFTIDFWARKCLPVLKCMF